MKMKQYIGVILLCVGLLFTINCSSSDDREVTSDAEFAKRVERAKAIKKSILQTDEDNQENAETEIYSYRIKKINLEPSNLKADSELIVNAELQPEKTEDENIDYTFWRNTEKIQEGGGNSFVFDGFKKGDTIFVDVIISEEGQERERRRSDMVVISNSNPKITKVEFPKILGPGIYKVIITAIDVDKGDILSFSFEDKEKVPAGMEIDSQSGIIVYTLKTQPAENIKFKVLVVDGDGGQDWRELELKFSKIEKKEAQE